MRGQSMKKIALVLALMAALLMATDADATRNGNGKLVLHFAGLHNTKTNTCTPAGLTDCTSMVVTGTTAAGSSYDIYVLAIDIAAIQECRFGLSYVGSFFFNGWTNCGLLEIPTDNWPGNGESNAVAWGTEQPGPLVVVGILDAYVYANSETISTVPDARIGTGEICDGTIPVAICNNFTNALQFGTVGVNGHTGESHCNVVATKSSTWAHVKSLYR
jgi:hypothetical protein